MNRALVETDNRAQWIGHFGIKIQHILHPGDIFAIDLGDAPHVLAPGLQIVLRQTAAHGFRGKLVMIGELHHLIGKKLKRPARPAHRRL